MALLAWQGKQVVARLDALERNQTRILIHLGIPPVAADTPEIGVSCACLGGVSGNQ